MAEVEGMAVVEEMAVVKGMAELSLELARLTGTSEEWPYVWLDELNGDPIRELFSLVDASVLDSFERGPVHQLCSHLDTIEENNLQFLRLSAGGLLPWRVLKYRCKLANLSQSFFRCISTGQWVRTSVMVGQNHHVREIRSNVVPRKAYLRKFEGVRASCPRGQLCPGGFFSTGTNLHARDPAFQSCTNCDLAAQLKGRIAQMGGAIVRFWYFEEKDVKLADDRPRIGEGSSEGEVYKILWRGGIFVKKLFKCVPGDESSAPGINNAFKSFKNEYDVAMAVSHPNLVHCFGWAIWKSADRQYNEWSLFMELLEKDLETHLHELSLNHAGIFFFSFRELLHVILQVAEAMEHLHERNFVHGDLKPANILLSELTMALCSSFSKFYLVKVADFGKAQRVDPASGVTVEHFSSNIGTFGYVAPEVLQHRKNSVPPSCPKKLDVYSFGVVAFQVLTEATADDLFNGCNREDVMRADTDKYQWRPNRGFDVGKLEADRLQLLPLVRRCWASRPESRPTFTEVCREIESILSREIEIHG